MLRGSEGYSAVFNQLLRERNRLWVCSRCRQALRAIDRVHVDNFPRVAKGEGDEHPAVCPQCVQAFLAMPAFSVGLSPLLRLVLE